MKKQVKIGDRIEMREPYKQMGVKIGDKATVIYIDYDNSFIAEFDREIDGHSGDGRGKDKHCCWIFLYRKFVIIDENHTEHKIVITADGNVTLARLYYDKTVIKSATAKCSPDDKFDFATGAKIAFARLIGEEKAEQEKKPQYYNGKVVCVRTGHSWWTVGKVYNVVDGVITADDGDQYPKCGEKPYKDAEDIRHAGSLDTMRHNLTNEFIPLVE